jgi:hypothetical protein
VNVLEVKFSEIRVTKKSTVVKGRIFKTSGPVQTVKDGETLTTYDRVEVGKFEHEFPGILLPKEIEEKMVAEAKKVNTDSRLGYADKDILVKLVSTTAVQSEAKAE